MSSLLWVEYVPGKRKSAEGRDEVSSAVKQHVMLHHLNKARSPPPVGRTRSDFTLSSKAHEESETTSLRPGVAITGSNVKTEPRSRATCRARFRRKPKGTRVQDFDYAPAPSHALIAARDRTMYNGAWWHHYQDRDADLPDWQTACKNTWSRALWEIAKLDPTFRSIFLCFAAAKEAYVRGYTSSEAFYKHKGETIASLYKDLAQEGKKLRIASLSAMCLLSKMEFTAKQFQASESHNRAIVLIAEGRLAHSPGFIWLFIVWADLRLTGVSSRRPLLPYFKHPEFLEPIPARLTAKARLLTALNMLSLPSIDDFLHGRVEELLDLLHKLSDAYDTPETPGNVAWAVSYDGAFLCAELQARFHMHGTIQEQLVLLSAQMQFWGTCAPFVPQDAIQSHLFDRFHFCLSETTFATLYAQWMEQGGSPNALVWIFVNAAISSMHRDSKPPPGWLLAPLRAMLGDLELDAAQLLDDCLRAFPYSQQWNGKLVTSIFEWITTGEMAVQEASKLHVTVFKGMRLAFDCEAAWRIA